MICFQTSAQESSNQFTFTPQLETTLPIFLGGGIKTSIGSHFAVGLNYGFTPQPYYQMIGQVAASIAGNSSYKDVIEASFQNNSIWRLNVQYNFNSNFSGWIVGGNFSLLNSSGKAGIDKVLNASTGRDYSGLKTLLTIAGRSTEVDVEGTLFIVELNGGYNWSFGSSFTITATAGIGKVFSSDIRLKTGLPNFEASVAGNSLMRSSESDLEAIVNQYGISPTVGITARYFF